MERRRVLLGVDLFIDNEASKDGISSHTIDGHEASADDVGEYEDAKSGDERWIQTIIEVFNFSDDDEANKGSNGSNEDFSEEDEDTSNTSDDTESEWVSEDKEEGILSGEAEVLACQSNLDVSILVQELNESFKAGNIALKATKNILNDLSFLSGHFLGLSFHISKDDSDHLDDSKDQRTESNGTKVVSEESLDTGANSSWSILTSSLREVPQAGWACKDELGSSNDEGIEPEETKQMIDQKSLKVSIVLKGSDWDSF